MNSNFKLKTITSLFFIFFILSSYAQKKSPRVVQDLLKNEIESLNFAESMELLESSKRFKEGNSRLVYYMEKGALLHYEGKYKESNEWFTKADFYIEDYFKQADEVILTYLSNPNSADYPGEDFEALYINYYKALNYIALNEYNEALVEAKRMNILMNLMNDKYPDNKFDKDAFIHLIMGLIYDANREYNDACIAYINAYEIYQGEYQKEFKLGPPNQLIIDITRTAKKAGLTEDYEKFNQLLIEKNLPLPENKGSVVILWHNGLAPKKVAQNISFTIVNTGGFYSFLDDSDNEEYKFAEGTLKSAAVLNSMITGQSGSYKMAFSKYHARNLKYTAATIRVKESESKFNLELCENVNAIAFQSHKDRKNRQLSDALARLVIRESAKTAGKMIAREGLKRIPGLGDFSELAAVGSDLAIDAMANSLERADVRQWSSLPHSIYYTRLNLEEGDHSLTFNASGSTDKYSEEIFTTIKGESVKFKIIKTMGNNGLSEEDLENKPEKSLTNMSSQLSATKELTKLITTPKEESLFVDKVSSLSGSDRSYFHPSTITSKEQCSSDLPGRYPSLGYKLPAIVLGIYSLPIFINGKREKLAANERRRRKLLFKENSTESLSPTDKVKLKRYEKTILDCYLKIKYKNKDAEPSHRKKDLADRGVYN